ncbi:hypothetical protein HRJ35_12900 [Shewanella oneidensis MR-1]|uniref:Lipoprotein n=1 Tax=Shewanella oneidensis (strain ATCC 700550 / JCM 31522 / CIP 106686 / LMG 19005 / NCIMB 14063 / MR-1) TaxID=211586 RepID=Q8EEW5_SHEON|nr:hypothetical protein [Shewanella oneidensis]AAN55287.1 putative lipoprotein [Shewanella oneidensis MR-1]MDX5996043.1 hypothetical protein [Shewanella oneidensis]MEE2029251.1 hypothetical protein [Shewanella oneidensis]QKG96817.1 hypothetical protein HRJ35_12900 [Shewanella oneidensis MR-1]
MNKIRMATLLSLMLLGGCASYTTPGGSVAIGSLAESDISALMSTQPAAIFPAHIAVARIQAPGYVSYRLSSFGTGRYSVVTTREVETEADFAQLAKMPQVAGIAPLNRILLPETLDSIKSLREAAARLKADMLLIYTFDTSFHAGEQQFAPLNVISLGLLKNKEVSVTTTVSAAMFDVRTEYLYGLAESTAKESRNASVWSTSDAVDDLRRLTEKQAFSQLIPEIEKTWAGVITQYSKTPANVTN